MFTVPFTIVNRYSHQFEDLPYSLMVMWPVAYLIVTSPSELQLI